MWDRCEHLRSDRTAEEMLRWNPTIFFYESDILHSMNNGHNRLIDTIPLNNTFCIKYTAK